MDLNKMTTDELRAELGRLRDSLCDIEEVHAFTFGKTSVHIGAEMAQNMQAEFEKECEEFNRRIAEIEEELAARG